MLSLDGTSSRARAGRLLRGVLRPAAAVLFCFAVVGSTLACEQLSRSLGGNDGSGTDAGVDAARPDAETTVTGAGCGMDPNSGATLCMATSMCPELVVDGEAMPNCGFRIRGSSVDLVCACGTALCPMGSFATCDEATQLLGSQTEAAVCVQLAEGRCFETNGATASPSSSSSSSSASSSGSNPACDRQCVRDCGGGAACATVCNCD